MDGSLSVPEIWLNRQVTDSARVDEEFYCGYREPVLSLGSIRGQVKACCRIPQGFGATMGNSFTSVKASLRIGPFVLDMHSGDLTRGNRPVRLQEKPRSLLLAMAERPGELITRAELHERLWPEDTFVDFEDGLNAAMSKLREALGDDPQTPRYIETVRGRGYRLIASALPDPARIKSSLETRLEPMPKIVGSTSGADARPGQEAQAQSAPASENQRRRSARLVWALVLGVLVMAASLAGWYWLAHGHAVLSFAGQGTLLIADFDNQTGDPRFDHALSTALDIGLRQSRYINVYSRLQAASALRLMARPENERLTPLTAREICLRESIPALIVPGISRLGSKYLLTAELINPSSGETVQTYSRTVPGEDQILNALDALATSIRRDLGESRLEIHSTHEPLPEVTTASLAALQSYVQGGELFGHARAADAAQKYLEALKLDPDFAMAHAALGYAYYSFYLNQPKLGEQEFQRALALPARTTSRERSWIGLRYAESQGRIGDALQLYSEYLQQYPGDWIARYSYARLLRMHSHARESLAIYDELASQHSDDPGLFIEMASARADLAQWPQSVAAYQRAFALDPHLLTIGSMSRSYGLTLVQNGEEAKAVQTWTDQLSEAETFADAERSLAILGLYHGHYLSARQRFLLALRRSSDPFSIARIHFMLAAVASGEGQTKEAIAQLDQIEMHLKSLPMNVQYSALLGQAYARAGAVEKARTLLDSALPRVNPRNEEEVAFGNLLQAEVALASGDTKGALQWLKPPNPDDGSSAAILTREALAHCYQKSADPARAIDWYEQFLRKGDMPILDWEPATRLAQAYFLLAADNRQAGNRVAAQRWINELLNRWQHADRDLSLFQSALRLKASLSVPGSMSR